MFFTNVARVLAWLAFVMGVVMTALGLAALQGDVDPPHARFTGRMIDRGIYTLLGAVALGTLAEISFTLRKNFENSK